MLLLTVGVWAQETPAQEEAEQRQERKQLDPIGDPFKMNSRVNFFYENKSKANGAGIQTFNFNPILAVSPHTSLQISLPLGYYYPGTTGNGFSHGTGDMDVQVFHRFNHGQEISHGAGMKITVDTGQIPNVGGGSTTLAGGYAFEYLPQDEDLKFILVATYENSLGTLAGTTPTRKAVLRLLGYHYIDEAYVGLELRQEFDFFAGQYLPYGIVSTGGEVSDEVQLWGSFRLALSDVARTNGERYRFTIGITVPLE